MIALLSGRGRGPPRRPRGRVLRRRRLPRPSPPRRCARSPAVGKRVTLHTHLVLRDDAITCTASPPRRSATCSCCCSASSRSARRSPSRCSAAGRRASCWARVAAGDLARLQAVPGIGKRTAERIVVELREKVGTVPPRATPIIVTPRATTRATLARDGLVALGFARRRRERLLDGAAGEHAPRTCRPRAARGPPVSIRTPGISFVHDPARARRTSSTSRCARAGSTSSSARTACASSSASRFGRPPRAARRSTTCCSRGRPASARRRSRRSSRPSSASRSCRPPARRSSARATSPRS